MILGTVCGTPSKVAHSDAQKRFAQISASSRPQNVMMTPYGRVIVMHLTILFGAALAAMFETKLAAFILLIALKIAVDIAAHVRKNFAPVTT